jgi:hypothetical protein
MSKDEGKTRGTWKKRLNPKGVECGVMKIIND